MSIALAQIRTGARLRDVRSLSVEGGDVDGLEDAIEQKRGTRCCFGDDVRGRRLVEAEADLVLGDEDRAEEANRDPF